MDSTVSDYLDGWTRTDPLIQAQANYFGVIRWLTNRYRDDIHRTVDPAERTRLTNQFHAALVQLSATYHDPLGLA